MEFASAEGQSRCRHRSGNGRASGGGRPSDTNSESEESHWQKASPKPPHCLPKASPKPVGREESRKSNQRKHETLKQQTTSGPFLLFLLSFFLSFFSPALDLAVGGRVGGWVSRRRGEGGGGGGGGERILKAFQNGDQKSQDGENAASSPSDFLFFFSQLKLSFKKWPRIPKKNPMLARNKKKRNVEDKLEKENSVR